MKTPINVCLRAMFKKSVRRLNLNFLDQTVNIQSKGERNWPTETQKRYGGSLVEFSKHHRHMFFDLSNGQTSVNLRNISTVIRFRKYILHLKWTKLKRYEQGNRNIVKPVRGVTGRFATWTFRIQSLFAPRRFASSRFGTYITSC